MDTDMSESRGRGGPSIMNLRDFHHHTLQFDYPAFHLLPSGKQPFFEMPKGLPDREQPVLTPMSLSDEDLDFFVRFSSEHGAPVNGTAGKREQGVLKGPLALDLPAAIDSLSSFAGVSVLGFVSYIDDWDVITRFELKSTFYTNFGKLEDQPQEFELGSADIAKMIRTKSGKEEWVRMLDDLIHVKSDRAYLFRHRQVWDWDPEWLSEDEDRWLTSWEANDLDSAKQLFANRLISVWQLPDGTIGSQKLGALDEFKDEAHYMQMPCGHRSFMRENYIQDMHPRDAITAECDECDQRVLKKEDIEKLEFYYDRVRRDKWEDRVEDWVPKCKTVRNDSTLVEISSGTLSGSLLNALSTFDVPASINPPSLCLNTYPESRALLNKLVDTLKQYHSLPAMTPKAMFTNLEKLAWQKIEQMVGDATLMANILPPGFEDFVTRWLTRAVNDAVGSEADDDQDEDMMEMITEMGKSKIHLDPKDAALEDDFDDILKQIAETLLGASADEPQDGGADKQAQNDEEDDEVL